MKESILYKKLPDNKVQCQTCSHYCILKENQKGICAVRENKGGKLYSLNYKKCIALNIDPIEKKPLYHFLPGTQTLSIAASGCNFKCWSCQNWQISQGPSLFNRIEGENLSPEDAVKFALKNKLPSISYTYTEPTVFLEYALETMKLAKGLKNIWVSNGFFSKETAKLVFPCLDAINIDLKSFNDDFYRKYCGGALKPVLENLKRINKEKIWLEITTLIIPGFNDSEEEIRKIAQFIKKLNPKIPWHISRFSGAISWKFQDIPNTSLKTLYQAEKIGKKAGLKNIHLGNI